jgi:hypothetical protein
MMTRTRKYTTELSKGQGAISETLAVLEIWEPGMKVSDLKQVVLNSGTIARATALRVKDIVGRVFASRYLVDEGRPAAYLKRLLQGGLRPTQLTQIFLIYTCRAHDILHDFICEVYWQKYAAGAKYIQRQDALDFIEAATTMGVISPRWSDTMMLRVARYLTGCLSDFGLAGEDKSGKRELIPFAITPLALLYLVHEMHFRGAHDDAIINHPDWKIFGLEPRDVVNELQRVANPHFILQYSGELLRVSWSNKTMDEALDAIIAAEF